MNKFKIVINLTLILFFLPVNFLLLVDFGSAENFADYQKSELLVKLKSSGEILKFEFADSVDLAGVISQYQKNDSVEYVELNYQVEMAAFPNDPDYNLQTYLQTIKARDAWSKELLARELENITRRPIIAVLDTGVDLDHPDLKDKIWINQYEVAGNGGDDDGNGYKDDKNGWDFVDNDNDPNPSFLGKYEKDAINHGTIVAGIAAADSHNQQGISGVSWFSRIMPLRVLDSTGSGDVYAVVKAIEYAIDNGADIINMSFVGNGYSQSLFNVIKRAYDNDILIVAAAGNTDSKINGVDLDVVRSYPVCYDGDNGENMVIGVASVGQDLTKSSFSNYGSCIDLAAPGESFYSTQVYNKNVAGFSSYYNGYWSGTSLSAPLVSGTLALIKGLRPSLSAETIRSFILENTKDIFSYNPDYQNKLGSGLLDSAKSLQAALEQRVPKEKGGEDNYIVAGLGSGSSPQLKIFKTDGSVFKSFYAYDPNFKGEINVAVGDVNADGKDEIVTGAGFSGGPYIRVFNIEGQVVSQFFAFSEDFRGGVNVAVGDVNGDGRDEIIAGSGKGGRPEVKVFDYQGNVITQFFAYDEDFLGGVKVASGDVDWDGRDEIVTGAGAGGGPHVKIFEAKGQLIYQFFAYNKNFTGGVNVACGDLHGDGQAEIIASIEKNSIPTVRIFNFRGVRLGGFYAYEPNFYSGVYASVGDIDNDGISEIITGRGVGGSAEVKVFDIDGRLKLDLLAHSQNYLGGVRPGVLRY